MPRLRKIALKSTLAAGLSVVASLTLALTLVPAIGGVVDGNAWLMCTLCPLVIAWPASAWQFWQQERLRAAHREIARLHDAVTQAHAELAEAHEALAERARRDGMTGLFNRDSFFAALEAAMAASDRGVLLIIDADHFKAINDRYGHPAGDAALMAIAGVVRSVARRGDLCGRIGGEEFAVYLPAATAEEGAAIAERIRGAVAALRLSDDAGTPITLSVSIGGAARKKGTPLAALFAQTDRQLYRAKRLGRDTVVLDKMLSAA